MSIVLLSCGGTNGTRDRGDEEGANPSRCSEPPLPASSLEPADIAKDYFVYSIRHASHGYVYPGHVESEKGRPMFVLHQGDKRYPLTYVPDTPEDAACIDSSRAPGMFDPFDVYSMSDPEEATAFSLFWYFEAPSPTAVEFDAWNIHVWTFDAAKGCIVRFPLLQDAVPDETQRFFELSTNGGKECGGPLNAEKVRDVPLPPAARDLDFLPDKGTERIRIDGDGLVISYATDQAPTRFPFEGTALDARTVSVSLYKKDPRTMYMRLTESGRRACGKDRQSEDKVRLFTIVTDEADNATCSRTWYRMDQEQQSESEGGGVKGHLFETVYTLPHGSLSYRRDYQEEDGPLSREREGRTCEALKAAEIAARQESDASQTPEAIAKAVDALPCECTPLAYTHDTRVTRGEIPPPPNCACRGKRHIGWSQSASYTLETAGNPDPLALSVGRWDEADEEDCTCCALKTE